jgi:hypothetical protein
VIPALIRGYFLDVDDFLGIYMNDQLALGTLWRELARRSQRNNSGTELGEALDVSRRGSQRMLRHSKGSCVALASQ